MRVLLISPCFVNWRYPLYLPSENLGLGYLASALRQAEIEVDIIDANMAELPAGVLRSQLPNKEYTAIGVAIPFQTAWEEAYYLTRILRKAYPSSHITVGGHFATFRHKEILEAAQTIDSVVRGDGEDSFLELIEALGRQGSLSDIAGLSFRNSRQEICICSNRSPRADLDSLPYPARDTLEYVRQKGHRWATQISSSRGCYASCAFCDIRSFYDRSWRARDPIKVVDEIEWVNQNYGSTLFRFTDDEFIGPRPARGLHGPKRARAFAEELLRRPLNVRLMIDARPEAVDLDLFSLLKSAGIIDCLVGIESGVDRILRLYNKGANVAKNLKAIEVLRRLDIALTLGFIMFDPRMSMMELKQNYDFLLQADVFTADAARSWLWPLFGTPVVQQLRSAGLIISESVSDVAFRFEDPAVGMVFENICKAARITFPLDYAIYRQRMDGDICTGDFEAVERQNQELWKSIFLAAMEERGFFEDNWIAARVQNLLADHFGKFSVGMVPRDVFVEEDASI